ncbi:MAG: DUF4314 domain-containing protein [Sphaerochaetaceae bacterium]|nr:DUF4314 domain-containing protein [Sphaerochaetaceae bacterium]
MDEMNRKRVEVLRKQYPPGCTVVLVSIDDELSRILDNSSYQEF